MSLYSHTECRKRDTLYCSTLYSFPFFSLENLFIFWQTLNLLLHTIITPVISLYYISKILSIMPRHYTQSTILRQHLQLSYVTIVSVGLVNNANSLNLNSLYITSSKKIYFNEMSMHPTYSKRMSVSSLIHCSKSPLDWGVLVSTNSRSTKQGPSSLIRLSA